MKTLLYSVCEEHILLALALRFRIHRKMDKETIQRKDLSLFLHLDSSHLELWRFEMVLK